MKILVIGSGGREHALVHRCAASPRVEKIYCAPGNAGIAREAECPGIGAGEGERLIAFARDNGIDLTVVGPEGPLVEGLADEFLKSGLRVFGPGVAASALEGSKSFAKKVMLSCGVPTARYQEFLDPFEAKGYLEKTGGPWVIKADGLAQGKGVVVTGDRHAAQKAVDEMMVARIFGDAGAKVLVEECLEGEEVSVMAFTDGRTVVMMPAAQDHKRVFDGDRGPNTGGMGAYAPTPFLTGDLAARVMEEILLPTVRGLAGEGIIYRGVLYAGLMITAQGPKVLEFNVRFGDPETQPVLSLLDTDLVEIMSGVVDGRLAQVPVKWKKAASVCVVLASGGYPGAYAKDRPISGLEEMPPGVTVFHAGTALKDNRLVTAGGRVLGVTATAGDVAGARELAYSAVDRIGFEGMHFRRDIARKALPAGSPV